jgi:hypothetical protein
MDIRPQFLPITEVTDYSITNDGIFQNLAEKIFGDIKNMMVLGRINDDEILKELIRQIKYQFTRSRFMCVYELKSRIILEYKDYIDWSKIDYNLVSEELIREFKDRIDWTKINYNNLSKEFIREFKDNVNWTRYSMYGLFKDEFAKEFQDRIDWSLASCRFLSEELIREFKDRINWTTIEYYHLSE